MSVRITLGVMLILSGLPSRAAPPSTPPITVTPPHDQNSQQDPTGTTTVIDPRTHRHRFRTLGELLKEVVGVQIRSAGGLGQRQSIFLRGTDSQQTLILLNGVRLNTSQGGGVDLSTLPLSMINRIVIVRGGSSANFGSDALGGVINIITVGKIRKRHTALEASLASFASYMAAVTHQQRWQSTQLLISARHLQSAGDFRYIDDNGRARTRHNNDARHHNLLLQLSGDASRRWRYRLLTEGALVDRGIAGLSEFPTPLAREQRYRFTGIVSVNGRALFRRWTTDNDCFFRLNHQHFSDPHPYASGPIDNRNRNYAWGLQHKSVVMLTGNYLLVGRIQLGVDWGNYQRAADRPIHPDRTSLGAMVGAELLFFQRLLVAPSLRLDWATVAGATVIPKLGIKWEALSWLTLKANAGRSYRLPSFDELYFDTGTVRGNPKLHPEDAWTFDLSLGLGNRKIGGSATVFFSLIHNLILFLPKTAYLIEADDSQSARIFGAELEISAHPLSWLGLRVSYTYTNARFRERPNYRLPLRSDHTLAGRLTVSWRWLLLFSEVLWRSRFAFDRFESTFEEGRLTINAGITLRPIQALSFTIEGRNLTDKRSAVDALQQPLPGLDLRATMRVEL